MYFVTEPTVEKPEVDIHFEEEIRAVIEDETVDLTCIQTETIEAPDLAELLLDAEIEEMFNSSDEEVADEESNRETAPESPKRK